MNLMLAKYYVNRYALVSLIIVFIVKYLHCLHCLILKTMLQRRSLNKHFFLILSYFLRICFWMWSYRVNGYKIFQCIPTSLILQQTMCLCFWHVIITDLCNLPNFIDWSISFDFLSSFPSPSPSVKIQICGHISMHFYFVFTNFKCTQIILFYGLHAVSCFLSPITKFWRPTNIVLCRPTTKGCMLFQVNPN